MVMQYSAAHSPMSMTVRAGRHLTQAADVDCPNCRAHISQGTIVSRNQGGSRNSGTTDQKRIGRNRFEQFSHGLRARIGVAYGDVDTNIIVKHQTSPTNDLAGCAVRTPLDCISKEIHNS